MRNNWNVIVLTVLALTVASCSEAEPQTPRSDEASVFDLVTECDVLAAHPDDPERMATGVADDDIVPRLAILACEDAVADDDDEPRYVFQLGRATLAKGDKDAALKHFKDAAEAGYAAAYGYLGDAYQFGLGVAVDPKAAYKNYEKAVQGGFEIAKSQLEQLSFERSEFTASYLEWFFRSDLDRIHTASTNKELAAIVRNYIYNLTETLTQECGRVVSPDNIMGYYNYKFPNNWSPEVDQKVGIAVQTAVGENDAKTFLRRHGCNGPVAKHVFANLNKFFERYKNR